MVRDGFTFDESTYKTRFYDPLQRLDKYFCMACAALFEQRIEEKVFISYHTRTDSPDFIARLDSGTNEIMITPSYIPSSYHHASMLPIQKFTEFYKGIATVYLNTDVNRRISVVSGIGEMSVERFICSIPVIAPWMFKEKPLSAEELKFIRTAADDNLICRAELVELMKKVDDAIKNNNMRGLLDSAITQFSRTKLSGIDSQIENMRRENERMANRIRENTVRLNELAMERIGVVSSTQVDNTDIIEYLLRTPAINIEGVSSDKFSFSVKTTAEYWDENMANMVINNPHSYLYDNVANKDVVMTIAQMVFIERSVSLRLLAKWEYKSGQGISPKKFDGVVPERDAVRNLHLCKYGCVGEYADVLSKLSLQADIIGMVEEAIASTASINFSDATVIASLGAELEMLLLQSDIRPFEIQGKAMNAKEVLGLEL